MTVGRCGMRHDLALGSAVGLRRANGVRVQQDRPRRLTGRLLAMATRARMYVDCMLCPKDTARSGQKKKSYRDVVS